MKDYESKVATFSKKEIEKLGYELVASGKIWTDASGQLHVDGSAEAIAYLVQLEINKDFEIAGVKFDSTGMAYLGEKATASLENSFKIGEDFLALRGKHKAEIIAGLWGTADSEIDLNKYGLKASGSAEIKMGTEVNTEYSLSSLSDKVNYILNGSAFVGAKQVLTLILVQVLMDLKPMLGLMLLLVLKLMPKLALR